MKRWLSVCSLIAGLTLSASAMGRSPKEDPDAATFDPHAEGRTATKYETGVLEEEKGSASSTPGEAASERSSDGYSAIGLSETERKALEKRNRTR